MNKSAYTLILLALAQSCQNKSFDYLEQSPPGPTQQVFAPGLVSLPDQEEFGSVFSKDGKEFFYGVSINDKAETRMMRYEDGAWMAPQPILIHDLYSYNDPFLSPEQDRLFFISNMPLEGAGEKKDYDIWYVQREGSGWSKPINAGSNINSNKNEYYISFTDKGTMYFSSNGGTTADTNENYDVYMAKKENGDFLPRVRLDDAVNTTEYEGDVFVAPDESYLIVCSMRPGGFGRGDLYVSFKAPDGTWTMAKNMGSEINKERTEYCPFVSADGKYFFYTGQQDIHWINADIINQLK